MASITSWTRLEPHIRNNEMNTGLQARIYDPLWMLARQWQVGEFQGEDNGSPVMARLRAESARLSRYLPGPVIAGSSVEGQKYDAAKYPLETLVERERVHSPEGESERLLFAAEAGLHFLRLLKQKQLTRDYRNGFLEQYKFTSLTPDQRQKMDEASLRSFDLIAPRSLDGAKLFQVLSRAPRASESGVLQLPDEPAIEPADLAEVREAVEIWLRWYRALFNEPPAANQSWVPERMEYAFSVSARSGAGERVLSANEYYDGRLDWYAFNAGAGALGAMADALPTQITRTTIPAPVTYRGMPSPRWWELEDAQVDFGAIDAGPEDLARLLMIEFAMSYGNDWFVIPVELPVGSLCQVRSLIITDTFGIRTLIQPGSLAGGVNANWRMFQLSRERPPNIFFLPPALIKAQESAPIEDVLFLRDEMANMAWAVERVIESPAGRSFNRKDAEYKNEPAPVEPSAEALVYRLASHVPGYWIPLIPVKIQPDKPDIQLQRGAMLSQDGRLEILRAQGRILNPFPAQALKIFEEEVPREGIRVTRTYQHARWLDGSTQLWVGRRKQIGRGEGSSGLQFDLAE